MLCSLLTQMVVDTDVMLLCMAGKQFRFKEHSVHWGLLLGCCCRMILTISCLVLVCGFSFFVLLHRISIQKRDEKNAIHKVYHRTIDFLQSLRTSLR